MRVSTPVDSTAGIAGDSFEERAVPALDESIACACAMTVSTFRDRAADDECKDECKYGEPFDDRRRRHRDSENCRLALAGVDRGSTALPLQNGDVEQGHADQKPHAEQARRARTANR